MSETPSTVSVVGREFWRVQHPRDERGHERGCGSRRRAGEYGAPRNLGDPSSRADAHRDQRDLDEQPGEFHLPVETCRDIDWWRNCFHLRSGVGGCWEYPHRLGHRHEWFRLQHAGDQRGDQRRHQHHSDEQLCPHDLWHREGGPDVDGDNRNLDAQSNLLHLSMETRRDADLGGHGLDLRSCHGRCRKHTDGFRRRREFWRVRAPPATSAATSAVAAAGGVPANTVPPAISGTPQVGQTLTATNGTWTNSPASFTYQWKRAGTSIGGATASTYVPVSADVGNTLTVSVTATNGSGFSTPATSAATSAVINMIPTNSSVPTISGIAKVGQTLTATTGTWTHNPTSFTYQWKRAGTPISGATASTYVPVTGDVGNTLTVSVVAANSGGFSAPATSAATSAVAAAGGVPANTVPPAISGTPQVGQTLTATNGTWTNSPASFTYQWKRAGTSIGGATASTYVPVSADVGNTLTVSVTATNGSGFSTPATSAATYKIATFLVFLSSIGNDAAAGTAVAPIKTISRALILCESAVLAASPAASYCRIVYLSDQYSLPSGLTS